MKNCLISIIIPIYNTEKYLRECLDSVINQSYNNLDIILINDGSTDRSKEICEEYKNNDSRIRLINQKNMGAAIAKNTGLDLIKGDWFLIVDSDDILSYNTVEILYSCAVNNKADVVEGKLTQSYDEFLNLLKISENFIDNIRIFDEEQGINELVIERYLHQTPCNKIYKSNLVKYTRFPQGRYIDDEYWTYKVFSNAKRIASIENMIYYYRKHDESAMGRPYSIRRLDSLDALMERAEFIKNKYPSLEAISIEKFLEHSIFNFQKLCFYKKLDLSKKYRKLILKNYRMYYKRYINIGNTSFKKRLLFNTFYKYPYLICNIRNTFRRGI